MTAPSPRHLCTLGQLAIASMLLAGIGCAQGPGGELAAAAAGGLTADHVVATGQACTPTGKHLEHGRFACATCHQCLGTVSFDPAVAGSGAAFDATTKNCSSVQCHSVPAGVFTYTVWDWGCDCPAEISVPYGDPNAGQPNWYSASGQGCNACHGYPPKYNGVAYTWHSGRHGSGVTNGNTCQLCHPDASGAYVYGGPPSYTSTSGGMIPSCAPGTFCAAPGAITNASLHGNGVLNVTPGWTSVCFGCH